MDFGFVSQVLNGELITYMQENIVVGQGIKLKNQYNLNQVCDLLGLKINNRYITEDIEMIEGFSALSPYKMVSGANNIQIAITESEIIVASPIIYGSY